MSLSSFVFTIWSVFYLTGGNLHHTNVSLFGEPTEFEYLRKVLFEYMMGRETKV